MDPVGAAVILAGIVIANAGAMLAAYVSIRVQLAVLQNIVKRLEQDVNNLAASMRNDGTLRSPKI